MEYNLMPSIKRNSIFTDWFRRSMYYKIHYYPLTHLPMMTRKRKYLIIEEPESHLSHTKMYELLSYLSGFDGQMFVSTHSSFVANKLSLNNLIVLGKSSGIIQSQRISDLEDYDFFAKSSELSKHYVWHFVIKAIFSGRTNR